METFNCTKCGLCCTQIGKALAGVRKLVNDGDTQPLYATAIDFPYDTDPITGRCSQLTENNMCAVYDDRPTICNIQKCQQVFFPDIPLDKFYKTQEEFCKKLQDDDQRNSQSV